MEDYEPLDYNEASLMILLLDDQGSQVPTKFNKTMAHVLFWRIKLLKRRMWLSIGRCWL